MCNHDYLTLQNDFNLLYNWSLTWQLTFQTSKYKHLATSWTIPILNHTILIPLRFLKICKLKKIITVQTSKRVWRTDHKQTNKQISVAKPGSFCLNWSVFSELMTCWGKQFQILIEIDRVVSHNDLGIQFDDQLKFHNHTTEVCAKANRILGMIKNI